MFAFPLLTYYFFMISAHSSFFDAEKPNTDSTTVNTQVGDGSCPVLPTDTEAESVCPLDYDSVLF